MQQLQQTVFHNLSKDTKYYSDSKVISQKHEQFPKYRQQQIANQFQLVDLHNKGSLTQKEIIQYLSDKYQWVNTSILKELFRGMYWNPTDQSVTKQEFVTKYLQRQKKLYNQISGLTFYQNWVSTLQQIFINQMKISKPRVYFYVQIRSVQLYHNSALQQWMDVIVQYENHQDKVHYQIQQALYNGNYSSYQIWLPARGDSFFLKFTFTDPNNRQYVFGQTYLNIPLQRQMSKLSNIDLQIMKGGNKVGDCLVCVYAEPNMQKVRQQLKEIRDKQHTFFQVNNDKIKQYQYLQFLWGIRHKSPHKISLLDVGWMLGIRMVLLIIIGLLGLLVHIFGRCQPLSIIISYLILRNWQYVLLRHEKFLLSWITVSAIMLDVIWVALCSGYQSQITFMSFQSSIELVLIFTYVLLGFKLVLLAYLLIAERSFDNSN